MIAVLGGQIVDRAAHIERVILVQNQSGQHDSFFVTAQDFSRCEQDLRAAGLTWLGFAHSHPDGPATPSSRDREQRWTGCLQVITNPRHINCFFIDDMRVVHTVPQDDTAPQDYTAPPEQTDQAPAAGATA